MLDDAIKTQLKDYLGRLSAPLQLTHFADDSEASGKMGQLLADIAGASERVTVVEKRGDAAERTPSFAIHRPDEAPRVRFAGLPLGHELTSLVLALLHVGGHPPKVDEATLKQVEALEGDYRFESYFNVSCQNCPDVVQALNMMAARNPHVQHVAIDGSLFRDEVDARKVMSVPTVLLNGEPFSVGRQELEQILAKVDEGASDRQAEVLNEKDPFDVLVVGGGPAGAAAAVYSVRKGFSTGLVAERFGGQLLDTLGVENFISVVETEGPNLASALENHVRAYPVDVMKSQRAQKLEGTGPFKLTLANGAELEAKTVVLATGARWRNIDVPGESEYRNRGVTYCPHCDGPLFKGKRVAVIGGGNSGVEAAIDLAGVVAHVTLLEFADTLKADDILQRKLKSLDNVDIITSARTTEIAGDGEKVVGLRYEDRTSGDEKSLDLQGVFVQVGLLPNTEWLKGTVELNQYGEVLIDAHGQTSTPGIYAAGDMTTVPFKQIIIASGDGAKAALGAFEYIIRSTAPAA
ncbi:MAG: alkyl hydroperoxide reductase subunit F [Myxococcota bacterium]